MDYHFVPVSTELVGNKSVRWTRVTAGVFAGFVLLAIADAIAIAVAVPSPSAGVSLRVAHYVFDAAETLGVGAVAALGVGAFVRFARLPSWALSCLVAAATIALAERTIGEPLLRFASETLRGERASTIVVGLLAVLGAGFPAALHVASLLSRYPRLRFLPVALAAGVLTADYVWLPDDYEAMHCLVAWGAAMVGGAGLAPLAEEAGRALVRKRSGLVLLAAIGLFGLFGVAWPPPNATRFELFRQPCALAPWVLATTLWRSPPLHAPVALPPSSLGRGPIDGTADSRLRRRHFCRRTPWSSSSQSTRSGPMPLSDLRTTRSSRLRRVEARGRRLHPRIGAGAQTASSLSTLFSGLYFSELRWMDHGVGDTRFLYAADDPAPRFPEILSGHGVRTANYAGLIFLGGEFGVVGRLPAREGRGEWTDATQRRTSSSTRSSSGSSTRRQARSSSTRT